MEIRRPRYFSLFGTSCIQAWFVSYGITKTPPSDVSKSRKPGPFYGRRRKRRLSPYEIVTTGAPRTMFRVLSRCLPM